MFTASRMIYICDHCHMNFLKSQECLDHEATNHKPTATHHRVRKINIKPDTSGFEQKINF